jgi:multisubunit Na+/H+ antiporter MnhF subunit
MIYYLLWVLIPITIAVIGLRSKRTMIEVIAVTIGVIGFVVTLVYLASYLAVAHDKVY